MERSFAAKMTGTVSPAVESLKSSDIAALISDHLVCLL
jgi:hypothetical protein